MKFQRWLALYLLFTISFLFLPFLKGFSQSINKQYIDNYIKTRNDKFDSTVLTAYFINGVLFAPERLNSKLAEWRGDDLIDISFLSPEDITKHFFHYKNNWIILITMKKPGSKYRSKSKH